MSDMLPSIVPKTDQLNADALLGGPLTIRITAVTVKPGEQPVTIHYEGENGRPWKPCKSMCRCLVQLWGADGKAYIGKSLTLYCDMTVKFGGMAVGGIRIEAMSDIGAVPRTLALTASKGKKAAFVVKPLAVEAPTPATQSLPTGEQQILASEFAAELSEYAGDVKKITDLGKRVKASRAKLGPLFTATIDPIIAAFNALEAAAKQV